METAKQELATVDQVPAPTVAADNVTGMVEMIERLAVSPDVDVTKLEKLVDLQIRMMDRRAEQAFNEAMKAAQEVMPSVVRDAENEQTHSRYARLETVSKAINPIITSNGFSTSFGTADSPLPDHYRVTCLVSHVGGHSREYQADVPADLTGMKGNKNKTATHGFGSTMSYGRRYLKLLIFDVSLTNDDDDGNKATGGPLLSDEQVMNLRELLESTDSDEAKFLAYAKVESLEDIYADKYDDAVRIINEAAAKRKAQAAS